MGFRYENFVSAGSDARYTICQKLCVFKVFEYILHIKACRDLAFCLKVLLDSLIV